MTKTFTLKGGLLDGQTVELSPLFPPPLPALYSSVLEFVVEGEKVHYSLADDDTEFYYPAKIVPRSKE